MKPGSTPLSIEGEPVTLGSTWLEDRDGNLFLACDYRGAGGDLGANTFVSAGTYHLKVAPAGAIGTSACWRDANDFRVVYPGPLGFPQRGNR